MSAFDQDSSVIPIFKRVVGLLARQAAAEFIRAGSAIAVSTSSAVTSLLHEFPVVTSGTDGGWR
jgi:hypothetical protein